MAEWRKVLVSGSNAHIAAITASTMGAISEDTEVIFRKASTGQFHTSGSDFNIKYTSSAGGQLYLDNIGLTAFNISASGIPNEVKDNSSIIFWNSTDYGLQTTSSLYFDDGNLTFLDGGTFSGSFAGDGSGLTGVVGTLAEALVSSNGIISSSGNNFQWTGSQQVEVTINTASDGGLDFTAGGLHLVSSLAGQGLYYPSASDNNYSTLSIDLSTNSGLDTSSNGLKLNDDLPGNGLTYSTANSVLAVDLADPSSGLKLIAAGLRLTESLAGTGLEWSSSYDILQIDTSYVVTSSNFVQFETGSTNLTLTGQNVTAAGNGYKGDLIDNPVFTYDLNSTLTGDFDITGNLTVEGNFVVSGTFTSVSFEVENVNIQDRFILVNSGSGEGDGGLAVQTGTTTAAFMFYDSESARWGVTNKFAQQDDESHSVLDVNNAAIITVQVTSSTETDILQFTPLFGTGDTNQQGQIVITTAPSTNESSVYIYA